VATTKVLPAQVLGLRPGEHNVDYRLHLSLTISLVSRTLYKYNPHLFGVLWYRAQGAATLFRSFASVVATWFFCKESESPLTVGVSFPQRMNFERRTGRDHHGRGSRFQDATVLPSPYGPDVDDQSIIPPAA